jgi:hypothetical protein
MPANGDNDKEIIVVVVVVAAVDFDSAGQIHGSPQNSAGRAVPGRWTDSGICGVVVAQYVNGYTTQVHFFELYLT